MWFGSNKPDISIFLDIFVKTMNRISSIGIPCVIKEKTVNIKVFLLLAPVENPARAPMNGTMQFNEIYGCDWCYHPGNYYGGSMSYPFTTPLPKERDVKQTLKYAAEATESGKPVFGVKSAPPLLKLNGLNLINGFCPEYMHFYLLGAVKQITECIFVRINASIEDLDTLLLDIKPPHVIGRLSRHLSHRDKWKAI